MAEEAEVVLPSTGVPILSLLAGFMQELRDAGLPVSLTENLDAMQAVRHIPLSDREAFKYALAATLVKNNAHWRAFETVFEVYFSLRGKEYAIGENGEQPDLGDLEELLEQMRQEGAEGMQGSGGGDSMTPEELAEMLYKALMEGNDALMRAVARQAVRRYAGMEPGRPVGGTYYLYRTLRNLDLDGVLERLMNETREQVPDMTQLEERLEHDEYQIRIDQLKQGDRGRDPPTPRGRPRRRGDGAHAAQAAARGHRLHARVREEMATLRRGDLPAHPQAGGAPGPQASPRAQGPARLPQHRAPLAVVRRRAGRAEVQVPAPGQARDLRHRRHLRLGGRLRPVHAAPRLRHRRQFSKVRSFVFIDGIDEVTRFFDGVEDIAEAVHRVNTEADVVWVDGHSDYGHALEVFWSEVGQGGRPEDDRADPRRRAEQLPRVAVLGAEGDAAPGARHVYWLNPEPRSYWDTGDSIVGEYGIHCDGVFECRNLRQLEGFVDHLA